MLHAKHKVVLLRQFNSLPSSLQVSLPKGYNVIMKDNLEEGLTRGHQQVYKGSVHYKSDDVPYSAKFLKHITFAVFTDSSRTVKIYSAKCFEKWVRPSRIVDPRNLFPRNVSNDQSTKI